MFWIFVVLISIMQLEDMIVKSFLDYRDLGYVLNSLIRSKFLSVFLLALLCSYPSECKIY